MTKKKYGPPSPADVVANHLRRRGVDLDPQRLEERLAAEKDREQREFNAYRDQVATLALAAKRARRATELAEWRWRQSPNADSLAEAQAAQRARTAAQEALRAELLYDEKLIAAVQLKYGR